MRSRYYRFGTVQTTCTSSSPSSQLAKRFTPFAGDDEVAPVVDPDKAAIGTIQVDLIRVRYREVRDRWATSTEVELNPGLVHERSEKAGMHRIMYVFTESSELATDAIPQIGTSRLCGENVRG